MSDTIEFMVTTPSIFPTPPGGYHYALMKMEHAYALEAALQAKGDYFGDIQRAIHPDTYPEPNPNPYHAESGINPYHGLVGFRFEILGTEDIKTAYQVVYDILHETIGDDHGLHVSEVMVSRGGPLKRPDNYHPHRHPSNEKPPRPE